MAIGYVLYNPKAGKGNDIEDLKFLEKVVAARLKFINMLKIVDYPAFLSGLDENDFIIIAGGDGTLNFFVNKTEGVDFKNEILYYPNGNGNDFARDLGYSKGCNPFTVNEYLKELPCVVVNKKKYRFINGIGYGIDGYCSEVGDELKKAGKKVNYALIAIKGLLFHYKTTNARVTVDGVTRTYKNVWLASTMNGRFYGGGMMPTPCQSRKGENGTLSVMVLFCPSKLKTLIAFPSLFKGEHVKRREMVEFFTGHEITVEFDRPTALQIDGETILGVASYTAMSYAKAQAESIEGEIRQPEVNTAV